MRSITSNLILWAFLLVPLGPLARSTIRADEPSREGTEFFEKEVRPLLAERCWSCHGDAKAPKGGLRLTSREGVLKGGDSGPAVVAGKPDEEPAHPGRPLPGRAQDAAQGEVEGPGDRDPVPLGRDGPALARRETGGAGRGDGDREAGSPTNSGGSGRSSRSRPSPPPTSATRPGPDPPSTASSWRRWRRRGSRPPRRPTSARLIRRATFDLIGLPPTPEEIDAFLADDSPEAFARVVDRLLASPQYGERWGRHWLDVVRYADARDLIQLPAGERLPRGLALSRLGRRRLQPRPALPRVPPPPGRRRPAPAARARRDQQGRAGRHGAAGHRRLRARRRRQGPDDRRLRQRPDRRRRPGLPGPHPRLRPLPRPQVRPDLHRGLLRPGRHLLQHPAHPRPRARQHAARPRAAPARRPNSRRSRRKTPPTAGGGRSSNGSSPTRPTANTSPT